MKEGVNGPPPNPIDVLPVGKTDIPLSVIVKRISKPFVCSVITNGFVG